MTEYFTSDQHFGHKNIIRLAGRPFDTMEEMHKTIVDNWNNIVEDDDTVYIIGDFAMNTKAHKKYWNKLKGNKVLIKGNHDNKGLLLAGFIEMYGLQFELIHNPEDSYNKYIIHGHQHQSGSKYRKVRGRHLVNVNLEHWGYKPVSKKQIIRLLKGV